MSEDARTWPDLAGRIFRDETGRRQHVLPIRVYFEDTEFLRARLPWVLCPLVRAGPVGFSAQGR